MEVIIAEDADEVARRAATRFVRAIAGRTAPVLGVATGSSPIGTYAELARRVSAGALDLSRASAFALDEYVGLDPDHPESYRSVIHRTVTTPLGLDPTRVHVPNGAADDIPRVCLDYERAISASGGVDVQLLGIGANGHIGFNEPSSSFGSRTRLKTLAPQTRADNARFFGAGTETPVHCITQGLGTILKARHLVLLAFGEGKAQAVADAVEGPLTAFLPGSAIQLHPHATVVVDEAAASRLKLADYYRYTFANKPAWQGI